MNEGDLPEGWVHAVLTELVEVLDNQRIPVNQKERDGRPGSVPYYGASGQVGTIDVPIFNEPLVLLGEDGVQFFDVDKPKAYLISGPAWVNNHAHVMRTCGVDGTYLKYFLDQADYRGLATGTTRLKLTQAAMKRIVVRLPPLAEQQRIAAEIERRFSHLDQAVACLHRSLRLIESAKESVDHQLLWSACYPAMPLADLLAPEGLTNGHSVKDRPGGFPVLRLTCLDEGTVDLSETKEGDWDRTEAEKYLVKGGDVLVSRGNGSLRLVGRGGLVPDSPAEVAYPDTLIRVRADRSKISPRYLAKVWNSQGIRRQLEAVARTTAGIYKVNQGHLRATLIPVPELELQKCLVDELERRSSLMSAAERTIEANLRKTEQLRRSLLHAAFSGKLVPQNPVDEAGSELLARIQAEREAQRDAEQATKKKEPAATGRRRKKELSA